MNVLIVDDEEDIGLMVSMFLKKKGISVDYADRITKAKNMIQAHAYEVYFLDLNLPDGTGFDLVDDIRNASEGAKVVIISAYDGVVETRRAAEMNIDHFIKKPFTKKQIIDAVNA
ncbi:response regulator [Reichenbachiella agariperforans]|uniref:response regulator n=1 Tax=Reichenbachiella agariperforans TaxID=156994 RepID=UPI001C08DA0F|nr:response regulator [Reichenbachiella agariperforans]MBU2913241.1 response regulator [Reichenbachiella agariperforans]